MAADRVTVTEESLDKYEAERLARLEKLAKAGAKAEVRAAYDWRPPKLNADGSLAVEERGKDQKAKAGSADAWKGTPQRGR